MTANASAVPMLLLALGLALTAALDTQATRAEAATLPELVAERDIAYRDDTPKPYNLLDVVHLRERPAGGRPAIVFVHGGSWRGGDKSNHNDVVDRYAQAGYVVANVNYRLSGVAKFPAAIEDVMASIRWLRANADRYGIDAHRIGIIGSSAGAHLAALAAVTSSHDDLGGRGPYLDQPTDVACVVARAGIYDLRAGAPGKSDYIETGIVAFLGGTPEGKPEMAREASPVAWLDKDDPPVLMIHGTADAKIPYPAAEHMAQSLKKAGVEYRLIAIEGLGHGGTPAPERAREVDEAVMDFLHRHLKRR